mmetsp:Transcript_9103/g.25933  ORF Transcript_9103/g.25933 Transcript_9103/m.25933 type:complete len:312 (-) Transcript_9103:273-1208(-)
MLVGKLHITSQLALERSAPGARMKHKQAGESLGLGLDEGVNVHLHGFDELRGDTIDVHIHELHNASVSRKLVVVNRNLIDQVAVLHHSHCAVPFQQLGCVQSDPQDLVPILVRTNVQVVPHIKRMDHKQKNHILERHSDRVSENEGPGHERTGKPHPQFDHVDAVERQRDHEHHHQAGRHNEGVKPFLYCLGVLQGNAQVVAIHKHVAENVVDHFDGQLSCTGRIEHVVPEALEIELTHASVQVWHHRQELAALDAPLVTLPARWAAQSERSGVVCTACANSLCATGIQPSIPRPAAKREAVVTPDARRLL